MLLVVGPEWAKDDVSYVFSNLDIRAAHANNRDPVLKPWNETNERACGSGIEHPWRLFPRAEWDALVEMGDKDAKPQRSTMQASCTVQGAWHQTVVASRATGRLLTRSSEDPSTRGTEAGVSMTRLVVECGAVVSHQYSLGILGRNPHIHPRDTLPCVLTMLTTVTTCQLQASVFGGYTGGALPNSQVHATATEALSRSHVKRYATGWKSQEMEPLITSYPAQQVKTKRVRLWISYRPGTCSFWVPNLNCQECRTRVANFS